MVQVAYDKQDVVIRLARDSVSMDVLARFLSFIELEQIRRQSKMTAAQAEKLAAEIDKNVWQNLKSQVLGFGND